MSEQRESERKTALFIFHITRIASTSNDVYGKAVFCMSIYIQHRTTIKSTNALREMAEWLTNTQTHTPLCVLYAYYRQREERATLTAPLSLFLPRVHRKMRKTDKTSHIK